MADNYLEKQYEDYKAKKAAWEKAKKFGKKNVQQSHVSQPEEEEEPDYENDIADNEEENGI